jgi:hypothetical protein
MHPILPERIDLILIQSEERDMSFDPPHTEEPLPRAKQASDLARQALEGLLADANTAGWASDEMIAAIAEAAGQLKDANLKDPDPAEDPDISDVPVDGGQLGHGERFD